MRALADTQWETPAQTALPVASQNGPRNFVQPKPAPIYLNLGNQQPDKDVLLISRNQTDFGNDYPQLIDSLKLLTAKSLIVDGEIAALDEKGGSSFVLLQSYGIRKQIPLVYYAFDLLSLEGTDLRSRPLVERRERLAKPSSF